MKCPVCGVRGCKNGSDHDEVQVYKCTNKDCARKTYSKKSIIVDNITGEEMIVANVRLAKTKTEAARHSEDRTKVFPRACSHRKCSCSV